MTPTIEDIFEVMARASCGERGPRVDVGAAPDADEPVTRLAIALNILLDDLEYRHDQAETYMTELLEERTLRLLEAEDAVRRREEFISVTGHELNTPLMSLSLTLEALQRGMIGGTLEDLRHSLALAGRQIRKLTSLVETLLGVGRTRSGQMSLRLEEVDLVALAAELKELLAPDLAKAGCVLSLDASGPVIGRWDRQRLTQVFTNILHNAIKFGKGRPITISIVKDGGIARTTIVDRGIGIAADVLPRVFELFERGVPTAHYGGLGIGLFIVREIVTAHGGTVRAESLPDEGTRIVFELPIDRPPTEGPA